MRLVISVGLVACALGMSTLGGQASEAGTADAEQIRIEGLRLGANPEAEPELRVFPEGTKTIFARFNYTGATGESLWLVITGRSGIELLRRSERYRGDGLATLQINGSDIYRTLTQTLDGAARAGQTSARSAASQQTGMLEYLMDTQYQVTRVEHALDLLVQVALPPTQADQLAAARAPATEIAGLLRSALALPPDDLPGKQALAAKMAAPFRALVTNAGLLVGTAGQVREVAIPGSGVDAPGASRLAFTLNLEVAGDIVVPSTEFWVRRSPPRSALYLPLTLLRHVPGTATVSIHLPLARKP